MPARIMVVDRIGPRIKVLVQRQRLSVNSLERVNRRETSEARIVVARAKVVQAEDRVELLSVEEESVDVGSRTLQESPEGGYSAEALGHAIFTVADTLQELNEMARDAVICHFEEETRPKSIRLHFVREEVIAV